MAVRPIQMMIAGAQKAGTSSLVRYLEQHPQVCAFPQHEFNFFGIDEEYALGYERIFPRYFGKCDSEQGAILAKSVDVMYLPTAAKRLYEHNPSVNVVFLLRHPVDRAYSAYWYARRMGWEPLTSFEEALAAGIERFQGNWLRERGCMYLRRSLYIDYLPLFFETFGRDQVHVFLLEDLKADTHGVCRYLFQVLGVDPDFVPDVERWHNRAGIVRSERVARLISSNSRFRHALHCLLPYRVRYGIRKAIQKLNEKEFTPPPMKPETQAQLIDYFKPYNARLSGLLGRDLSHWDVLD